MMSVPAREQREQRTIAPIGVDFRLALLSLLMRSRSAGNPGAEAIAVGAGAAAQAGDRLCAPHAYLGAHLALELSGEQPGGIGSRSLAPDLCLLATGMALTGEPSAAVITVAPDTALVTQAWAEAFALARTRSAPLVVVVDQAGPGEPGGSGPPMLGEAVDGMDVEAVISATMAACDRARDRRGPAIVQCVRRLPRAWERRLAGNDPAERFARLLFATGIPRGRIDAAVAAGRQ